MSNGQQPSANTGRRRMGGPGPGPGMGPRRGGPPGPHGRMMPVEKPKNFRKTFFRLLHYIRPHLVPLTIVLVLAVVGTVFNTVGPKIMGEATTVLFEGMMSRMRGVDGAAVDFGRIAKILRLLIILYGVSALFRYFEQIIMAGISQRTIYHLRNEVSEKIVRLPLKFYDSHAHGDILSRMANDIDLIGNTLQQGLAQVIEAIITIVGVLAMMIWISGWMTLITLFTLPAAFVITRIVTGYSQRYFARRQEELGQLNGHVEEMLGGHLVVKAFNYEKRSTEEFNHINEKLYDSSWKAEFVTGIIMPLLNLVNNISYVAVAVVGGIFVTQGRIPIGDVQAFIQYSRQFTRPIDTAANVINVFQSTIAAAERVFELLDEEEQVPEKENALADFQAKGNVRFEHVKFGYTPGKLLMHDINIDVKSGQTVAIVGPTGAGKTTLVNLLMRFYEVNGGRITIDGVDIRDLKRDTLRSIFGMVLQDTWLFKGTIRDNIAYGKKGATTEEVIAAAKAAQVDHFIRTLPDGYDTVLNEDASNISQGQKQLLTIARAILADPEILILDEATSSVDTRTEILIQKAMGELMKGRTNFVIAHRLSTIRDADLIMVMQHGDVVESGTHAELLAANGVYADIYNSQFSTEDFDQPGDFSAEGVFS